MYRIDRVPVRPRRRVIDGRLLRRQRLRVFQERVQLSLAERLALAFARLQPRLAFDHRLVDVASPVKFLHLADILVVNQIDLFRTGRRADRIAF
jgi:hypothetical protein